MKKIYKNIVVGILVLLILVSISMVFGFNPVTYVKSLSAYFQIPDPKAHENYAGVISIPSVGIEVDCIAVAAGNKKMSEMIVNRNDCAAKILYDEAELNPETITNGRWVIGDHNYQGFEAIRECKIGDAVFLIDEYGNISEYSVVRCVSGFDGGANLFDEEGNYIFQPNSNYIVLMTCYPEANVPAVEEARRYFVLIEPVE
uniref:hypothetical protein n=1 Tax=Acetatifactor sp. TaxID=1872090 RepID=UPI004056D2A7